MRMVDNVVKHGNDLLLCFPDVLVDWKLKSLSKNINHKYSTAHVTCLSLTVLEDSSDTRDCWQTTKGCYVQHVSFVIIYTVYREMHRYY